MKKLIVLFLSIFILLNFYRISYTFASESSLNSSYSSEGEISFYGKYEEPLILDEKIPVPELNHSQNEIELGSGEIKTPTNQKHLPQTGEKLYFMKNTISIFLIGIAILALNRNKKTKSGGIIK